MQARRPPGAPVLHLALSDGARGDRLVGRPGADLPERLARRDPDEARRDRRRHHRAVLLDEARASRDDDDGAAVRPTSPETDHGDERRARRRARRTVVSRRATAASRWTTPARSSGDGKRIRNERYTVEYDAENAIVERGPSSELHPPSGSDAKRPRPLSGWTHDVRPVAYDGVHGKGDRPARLLRMRHHDRALARQVPGLRGIRIARRGADGARGWLTRRPEGQALHSGPQGAPEARGRQRRGGGTNLDRRSRARSCPGRWARSGVPRSRRWGAGGREVDACC